MMQDFAPDAVILAGPRPTRGTDAIRAFVAGASADVEGFELDASVSEGEHYYVKWHTASGLRGTDTFVIHDGKIVLATAFAFA
jgi:hypothetical protein